MNMNILLPDGYSLEYSLNKLYRIYAKYSKLNILLKDYLNTHRLL